jgi:UDP-galactopyranose mutase
VFFVEEPVREEGGAYLRSYVCSETGVQVCTPVLPPHCSDAEATEWQREFLRSLLEEERISDYLLWYYTPMALEFSRDIEGAVTVYDCMDELSGFAGAPAALRKNEMALFKKADLIFTGGTSLFEAKRLQHRSVHLFPSSVDVVHFERARTRQEEPSDQARIAKPRLGYAGVIDERMDLELIRYIAAERPEWQLILLGPVAKIDPAALPTAPNIHYLGIKQYAELPRYLAGWRIGMLPFALNEATRFISPTKTPEYLAAGLRVVATPIRDVISPYGDLGLVGIAQTPKEFVEIADGFLANEVLNEVLDEFHDQADEFLRRSSWDSVWRNMDDLIKEARYNKEPASKDMAHV